MFRFMFWKCMQIIAYLFKNTDFAYLNIYI